MAMVDELRKSLMVKRSINKKKIGPVNYKNRVFSLTNTHIYYFEGTLDKKGREKGQIDLSKVKVIEEVDFSFDNKYNGIQIVYEDNGQDYTLYFFADTQRDQKEWLSDLQRMCRMNGNLSDRFHKGAWGRNGKWTCCEQVSQASPGCMNTFKHQATLASNKGYGPASQIPTSPFIPPKRHQNSSQNPTIPFGNQNSASSNASSTSSIGSGGSGRNGHHHHHHQYRDQSRGTPLRPDKPLPKPPSTDKVAIIVVAKFDYEPMEKSDIALKQGEEYTVLDNSREYWWKAKNKHGKEGYIPSNYVEEKSKFSTGLERYEWFNGTWSRQRTEMELKAERKEGCFIVRNSSTQGLYTLSILTLAQGQGDDVVRHYHIKRNGQDVFISEKHSFLAIPQLIEYHKHNAGGLITRLRNPPGYIPPSTAGLGADKWEVDRSELTVLKELGSGQFGVVRLAKLNNCNKYVAVKIMREGAMSEDDFIDEAKVMKELSHEHLVQLYGVCSKRPICIITEYMAKGCLLFYLRRHLDLLDNSDFLLHMILQVCSAMKYLEKKNIIHRDLAARNCLVGERNIVKVADFGLARFVIDDEYTSSGTKFPIKWAPPEVLHYTKFSSKSDVWAFGILTWEVFSGGKTPYATMTNVDVVEQVTRKGYRMERPESCPVEIYRIMMKTWREMPEDRPAFGTLYQKLAALMSYEEKSDVF